ncbi:MFS transporter [Costertonia aggregata]|uniref:MFS transporter n=1 Tax=Costertonia aggregata TaxID=343403 RepID=A0A7H9AKN2_9FLAO|nr:MFS transporter [Costertonia aggregata]QLG43967.1 MFS transporter [Costertonia aggregata]
MKQKNHILPIIILSQFACTSPWFAGNAIIDELTVKTGLGIEIMAYVLASVQLGFISGTLVFALFMIADRFSPSVVFMICAILAALCNLSLLSEHIGKWSLLLARFGTGFFLAGIYPVGMKIAADYYEKGLGKALGYLVGALVLGTAFPYLINGTAFGRNPDMVIKITTGFTIMGGLLMVVLVPNGPFRRPSTKLQLQSGPKLFKIVNFRKAAFGYFGHMWELYAFWAFTPLAIQTFNTLTGNTLEVFLWTGIIIMLGGISCALGGILSIRFGSYTVAFVALLASGFLCLVSPVLFSSYPVVFLGVWYVWGMAVTADSPQFSNLVASSAPAELKGTGLTLVNCIGFAITIGSIQLLSFLSNEISPEYIFMVLAIGPLFGVWQLSSRKTD